MRKYEERERDGGGAERERDIKDNIEKNEERKLYVRKKGKRKEGIYEER